MFEISRHDLITTQTGVRSIAGQPVGLRTAKNLPGAAEIKRQVSNNARLRLGPKDWDAPEGDEEQADDLVATTLTLAQNPFYVKTVVHRLNFFV